VDIEIKIWKLVTAVSLLKRHKPRFQREDEYCGGGFNLACGPIIIDWIRYENAGYTR